MASVKKNETKAVVLKEEAKAEAPVAAPVKAAEVKKEAEAPKKAETPKKPAAPKAPVKKEIKSKIYVQYMDKEVLTEKLVTEAKKAYIKAGNKEADIKTIDIYIKPEEHAAYYVVNGVGSEEYKINL